MLIATKWHLSCQNGRLIATVKGRHIDGGIIAGCSERKEGEGGVSTKKGKLQNADAHAIRTDACAPLTFDPLRCRLLSYVYKRIFITYTINKNVFYLLTFF